MIEGKQMYEFMKKYRPNDLGTAIIDYVEQLKADKQALKKQLTLTDVVKPFYCVSSATGHEDCEKQCDGCKGFVFDD